MVARRVTGVMLRRGGWQGMRLRVVEGAVDEGAEVPAVEVFVGGFAGGVVAAGEDRGDVVDAVAVEVLEDVERELAGEGEVVGGVDDEAALGVARRTAPCRPWG